ncbi:MAG: right-handed parallel beta-helix repeat-containing protein [Pirellula sp.]|jgi:hypothetical protein|nr:right-handed parallel beta-helix repeat-containing protein [Pirellula sp.]
MNITTSLLGILFLPTVSSIKEIHVSPSGDDFKSGTVHEPVQTLHCAQQKARELNGESRDYAVRIVLHEGVYQLKQPLLFNRSDSSPTNHPTIMESMPGERVVITGAEYLHDQGVLSSGPDFDRLPSKSKTHVHWYRISNAELKSRLENYLRSEDAGMLPSPIDLFKRGELMPIATYPSQGRWAIAGQDTMPPPDSYETSSLWLHSLFTSNDQDRYERFTRDRCDALPQGVRYRVENSIRELDEPGEWCFDEATSTVYWWPTTDDTELNASSIETLFSLYDVDNMIIRGICFEGARVQGVEIAGGSHCHVENCEFQCIGNVGIHVFHGEQHTIKDCSVHSTGSSGIRMEGGDAGLDIKAGHHCINNTVYQCCQKNLTRHAGIAVFGCGISLANNSVSELPDWGISIQGSNNQAIENEVQNVCLETSDTGAIYVAGSQDTKQNRIHGNHIHNVGAFDQKNAFAVYLDGMTSDNDVAQNIIHDVVRAVVVRDGHDNRIVQNAIYDCLIGVQIEQRQEVTPNEITSNALACQHPIVCNHDHSVLTAANNTKEIERVFGNYRSGDFRITSSNDTKRDGFEPLRLPNMGERDSSESRHTELATK